jgi:lycopene beta-cyclase
MAMASHFQYLLLLAACVAFTFPLELFYRFRVWRAPRRLFCAVWPGFVAFWIFDLVAIHRGYWYFSQKYTVGWYLPGHIPIEEVLFFLIVPTAAISGFEAVRTSLTGRRCG